MMKSYEMSAPVDKSPPEAPEMSLALDKIRELVLEARRLDVKEGDTDPDSGSDAIDDGDIGMLSSSDDEDGSEHEFRGMVAGLNVDERADLLALIYIGRGDFGADEWAEARELATERDADNPHLGNYLVGTPNLADLLDEGLSALGFNLEDDDEDTETSE
jgi:hypothetical protein